MSQSSTHHYQVNLIWTGNFGQGTSDYRAYARSHEIVVPGKPKILGSADPAFRGDRNRYNPEELLLASIASCHMLWYLHLCADAQISVLQYADSPTGVMRETAEGGGRFEAVTLKPEVTIAAGGGAALAIQLHDRAHQCCFIANSVNFPISCEPSLQIQLKG